MKHNRKIQLAFDENKRSFKKIQRFGKELDNKVKFHLMYSTPGLGV